MDQVKEFIKPELIILIPVIYFIGVGMKNTKKIKDEYIPVLLGVCGVFLASLWVIATCNVITYRDIIMALFTAITQGILVCAGSVYINQVIKQANKDK
jgi:hypothetical protein